MAATNSNVVIVEYPFGEVDWRAELAPGETVNGDIIGVHGPGYGIEFRPERAGTRRHAQ